MMVQTHAVSVGLPKRRAAEQLGRRAEHDVARLLQEHGFKILAQRHKTSGGEIDLIVANQDVLVFVEVKARPSLAQAAYALSARQQMRLWQAAEISLAQNPDWARAGMRFDAALVTPSGIEIIEDIIRLH